MSCCKSEGKKVPKDVPLEVSSEVQLWINMMKYMLECSEMSMAVIRNAKNNLEFTDGDLERFDDLCLVLDQVRHQLALLGQNFMKLPALPEPKKIESFTQPQPLKKESRGAQTNEIETQVIREKEEKPSKELLPKDACLCEAFSEKSIQRSRHHPIVVCSTLKRSIFITEKCGRNYKPCVEQSEDQTSTRPTDSEMDNDDDNPYIIKDPGGIDFDLCYGVGYELFSAMKKYSNVVAQYIEATDEEQTFAELLHDSISIAIKLREKGLDEEDIICLCVSNTKYACMPYIAGLFVGVQMNAVDISFGVPDMAFLLKLVTPTIMFVQYEKFPVVKAAIDESNLSIEIVLIGGEKEGYESIDDYLKASDDDIKKFKPYKVDSMHRTCIILFSSGTSGFPKGICLSHLNMLNQFVLSVLPGYMRSAFLSYTSFYWISAVILMGVTLLGGISRVVPLPFNPISLHKLIMKYKIHTVFLGPYECIVLIHTPKPAEVDTSTLKVLVTGGANLKDIIFYALRKVYPGCMVMQIYGQTETGGALLKWSLNDPKEVALCWAKPSSAGKSFGGIWYKIVDEENEKILGPNQPGELYVKSDKLVMKGYYKRDSSECFDKSGWLKTGDLVYYDDYQCFFVIDRVKELIKYRGWHVPPVILEHLLMSHPVVARAVVVGLPNDEDGEHPTGLIILRDGVDPETVDVNQIAEFVNKQVDERKQLRGGVKIIKHIPLTATGKVRRRSLRDALLLGEDV